MSGRPPVIETDRAKLAAFCERMKARAEDDPADQAMLEGLIAMLVWVLDELAAKRVAIRRLKRMLFGAQTERTSKVTPKPEGESSKDDSEARSGAEGTAGSDDTEEKDPKKKRPGHGRRGAEEYTGASRDSVPHGSLSVGDSCPGCPKGRLYGLTPRVIVRVVGQAPLAATVTELERLRCNGCGGLFGAEIPEELGPKKYDATAASMIAALRYGSGLPFTRLERLESSMGIPLPPSTQWDVVAAAHGLVAPAFDELIRQAAQGEVVHNDDTPTKILERMKEVQSLEDGERTGTFTSGIVSVTAGRRIVLFFTGAQHAGENLADVLAHRESGVPPPIQMCDALSRNLPGSFKTILANCIAHARRKFVDVAPSFPDECRHVLEELGKVYRIDDEAREARLSAEERLRLHQEQSAPIMKDLKIWLAAELEEKRFEPNSGLGKAIKYLLGHWDAFTLFLRTPGAPIDNNVCERALKKAILHRKNSYFYKTQNGARVGDTYMSLIYTAELAGVSPFDYLTELQRHALEVREQPDQWMPWNYRGTLAALDETPLAA